jgi:alkanesulfonate monooxygenase SsuD/methylene tetrahydromethanopterin reductase-like flavin-dependent oxidoreductase (luciferase family)
VIASAGSVEAMKEYRDDVKARAVAHGRKPDDVKVLFLVSPVLGESDREAAERKERGIAGAAAHPEMRLAGLGYATDIDFSRFDLDTPLGRFADQLTTNGHQSSLAAFIRGNEHRTLRDLAATPSVSNRVELLGTPDRVAGVMADIMDEVGGDGFLISLEVTTRRSIAEITDGLVPALQKRGLTRTEYTYEQFRDNLLEF